MRNEVEKFACRENHSNSLYILKQNTEPYLKDEVTLLVLVVCCASDHFYPSGFQIWTEHIKSFEATSQRYQNSNNVVRTTSSHCYLSEEYRCMADILSVSCTPPLSSVSAPWRILWADWRARFQRSKGLDIKQETTQFLFYLSKAPLWISQTH